MYRFYCCFFFFWSLYTRFRIAGEHRSSTLKKVFGSKLDVVERLDSEGHFLKLSKLKNFYGIYQEKLKKTRKITENNFRQNRFCFL